MPLICSAMFFVGRHFPSARCLKVLARLGIVVLLQQFVESAVGRGSSIEKVAPFLDLDNLKPFVDNELESSTKPIIFQLKTGARAFGYRAE